MTNDARPGSGPNARAPSTSKGGSPAVSGDAGMGVIRHSSFVLPAPVPPRGLRGLLAISFMSAARGTVSGYVVGILCLGVWVGALVAGAPAAVLLCVALVVLPGGLLVVPVVGVLHGQRLPLDYRQLGVREQLGLWLRGPRPGRWPLPAGALTDPAVRRHAALIGARAGQIAPLSPGARAVVAADLRGELAGVRDPAAAARLIDEAIGRVARWEEGAAGLPPVGGKLYLRHDPLSKRAAEVRRTAARLGVPSDKLNYFWHGQVLLLPPARSHRTLAALVDALLAAGVADAGAPLPLQITVQGALGDDAKLIALAQLLASGLDLVVQGPERRGDEGNLIARGRYAPQPVAGDPGRDRSDFLFSLVWATVPDIAAAGYADQHHRDLRVVQTLSTALLAAQRAGAVRDPRDARLASVWEEFAGGFVRLCSAWGVGDAVRARYLNVPFATVRPGIERLLARKAEEPELCLLARRLRDRALALVELTVAVQRVMSTGRVRRISLRWAGEAHDEDQPLRPGLRRVRRAIRAGARVALITRAGDTMQVILDGPASAGQEEA